MRKWVLHNYAGIGTSAEELDQIIDETEGVNLLDHEVLPLCLIEASDDGLENLRNKIQGWNISPEIRYSIPKTGPTL